MIASCPILMVSLLAIGGVALNTDKSWTPDLVFEFFRAKFIHQVDNFVCNINDGVHLLQFFIRSNNSGGYPISVRTLREWSPDGNPNGRTGVFIDLSCHENLILMQAAVESWFDMNYSWLIADEDGNTLESERLRLSLYSDVVLLRNGELHQVTNFVKNTPLESFQVGHWKRSENILNMTVPVITPNLQGTYLTGSYFAVQDIYDKKNVSKQLQDPNFKHGFDSGNRFFYAVILAVSDIYNFSMDLVEAQEWGLRSPNGSWRGIVGQLQTGKSDVGLTPLLPFSERLEVTYALPVLQRYWFALIFKQPRALGTYKAMILELSPALWGMVILTCVVGALVVNWTLKCEDDHRSTLDLGVVQAVGILANQGLSVIPRRTSARIACFSLMFVGLLVSNYYNASTMTALLSEAPPTIKTFDDFLKSDIPIELINATYMTRISGRKRVFHPKSWNRALGDLRIVSLQEGLEAIRNGHAFCAEYYILFEGIDSNFKDEEKCSLTVFSVNVVYTGMRFVRKDAHLLEMLSRGLIKTLEYGISIKKRNDWIKGPPSCFRNVPFVHVRLESVSIAFGIFLAGVTLAMAVFIIEQLWRRKSQQIKGIRMPVHVSETMSHAVAISHTSTYKRNQ